MSLPAGVLWDLDGTIVDTEPYFTDAVTGLVTAAGGVLTDEDHVALVGANLWDMAAIAIAAGARDRAPAIVADVLTDVQRRLATGIPWRPGALELLAAVRAAGIPTGLVTMSFRTVADAVVANIPFDAFDVVVTGDEVARGKPDPEAYLRAAQLLGVDITRCVVLEDSPPGVAAGVAAGAAVVAVPFYVDLPASEDHTTWDTLVGKDVSSLVEVADRGPGRGPGPGRPLERAGRDGATAEPAASGR
ncbi:HAD family hydrolase [Geodermatophilus sp. SYSU D01105]